MNELRVNILKRLPFLPKYGEKESKPNSVVF